jgi:transposase
MRGTFEDQRGMFSYISPESRVPTNHPLRTIRKLVRDVLKELSWSFARLYAKEGRPPVPPEQLLSALLIQVLYGIRSVRHFVVAGSVIVRSGAAREPRSPATDRTADR